MPRLLLVVGLTCAIAVIAAVLSLRDDRAHAELDLEARPAISTELDADVALAATSSSEASSSAPRERAPRERAPIAVQAEQPRPTEDSASPIRGYDFVSSDVSLRERPPAFTNGVVLVHVMREEDGQPLPNAEVLLECESYWLTERPVSRSQRTDSDGTTTFDGVVEGRAQITVTVAGRAPATNWVVVHRLNPSTTVEIRSPLRREFVVRLLDGLGRPFRAEDWHLSREHAALLGIRVSGACGSVGRAFEARDAPAHTARSTNSELGPFTWRVELRGAGDVCVHAVLGSTTLGVTQVPADATDLAIRIDTAALDAAHGTVVVRVLDDVDGTPMVGAEVEFTGAGPNKMVLKTESDGRVRADLVPSANLAAIARAVGRVPVAAPIERSNRSELVLRLPVGRRIEGRVVDARGNPIADAGVELQMPERGLLSLAAMRTKSKTDGTFTLTGLPPGQYEVRTYFRTERSSAIADCRDADALGVVIAHGG